MKILDLLQDNDVFTPTEISKETDISKQNVSRNLRKLQEKELVSCINPDSHKYKYFEITERGETMLEEKEKR